MWVVSFLCMLISHAWDKTFSDIALSFHLQLKVVSSHLHHINIFLYSLFFQFLLSIGKKPSHFNGRGSFFSMMNIMRPNGNIPVLTYEEKEYFENLFYPASSSTSSSSSSSASLSSSASSNKQDPISIDGDITTETPNSNPLEKSTSVLRALLKDLSEKSSITWNDLTTQLGKGYRDLSTEDEVMLLHKSLIKFSREGASSKKSQRKEGRIRHEHSALGQFGTYQVNTHAQYFAKLVTLAVMPSKRSNVARSMKSNNVNLLGVAQRNTISIMNTAVKDVDVDVIL
jgi:hypothetical protein